MKTTWLKRAAVVAVVLSAASLLPATTPSLHAQGAAATMQPLRAGDGIKLKIFREPEMSGEFIVDERGIVVLPRLGDWSVAAIPADSVRARLLGELTKYLRPEAIEISLFRRVAITGQVGRPGLYPIDPSVTVAEAIILAGGRAPRADGDFVEIRDAASSEGPLLCPEDRVWDTPVGGNKQLHVPIQPWVRRNGFVTFTSALSIVGTIALISLRFGR
jgi:protein involved in polysaccharide export with SLBB domain